MNDAVFVTGGSGLLALNWAVAIRDRAAVTLGLHERQVTLARVRHHCGGLDTADEVSRALDVVRPRAVIHTAGITNIEECEADPQRAWHVNVELAVNVAAACARHGVPLVHLSTDHLFRGDQALVDEGHPLDPQNVYAQTKSASEARVLEANPTALVVRTNFYGWGPGYRRSFSDRIIDSLRKGAPITLFSDVWFTPVLAESLVMAVHDLLRLNAGGIVHVVGDERVSKYDFGIRVARCFELDANLITPGVLADQPSLVRRPRDMSLSNKRASGLLGRPIGSVDEHLLRLREQEHAGLARELQDL